MNNKIKNKRLLAKINKDLDPINQNSRAWISLSVYDGSIVLDGSFTFQEIIAMADIFKKYPLIQEHNPVLTTKTKKNNT